jgi:hypothetical protein
VTGKPDRLGFYGLLVEQVMQALRMADLVNAIADRMMNFFQAVRPFTFLNGTGTIIITTSSLACFVVPGKQRACGSEAGGKTGQDQDGRPGKVGFHDDSFRVGNFQEEGGKPPPQA